MQRRKETRKIIHVKELADDRMTRSPTYTFPLLLKLSAAALASAVAAIVAARIIRTESLSSLRRDVRAALLALPEVPRRKDGNGSRESSSPPVILVIGFQSQGKSAFVNTACRTLAGEKGPLVIRSETAPLGPTAATMAPRTVLAGVGLGGGAEEGEGGFLEVMMVDGRPLPDAAKLTKEDVEAAVAGGGGAVAPECIVVVLRCRASTKERHEAIKRLTEVATVIREQGLNLVVVLTHKKSLKTRKQVEELRREVTSKARTDCVFFVENYTAGSTVKLDTPTIIKNDFETDFTVLAIIRQCIQFISLHRKGAPPSKSSPAVDGTSVPFSLPP